MSDSPDAFRQYLVEEYVQYRLLGFHQYELSYDPGDADELARRLAIQASLHGRQVLLPQFLSEELLQRLIGHEHRRRSESAERNSGSLVPVVCCVFHLRHALLLKDDPTTEQFTMSVDELAIATSYYYLWLEMELITRHTRVKFTPPTLETIFEPTAVVSVRLADLE
jgi:hypothetical protein